MKRFDWILVLCVALVGSAGCGGSSNDGGSNGGAFQSSLQGTWSTCLLTGAGTSARLTIVFSGKSFTETGFNYSNTTCTGSGSLVLVGWGTLTIGSAMTVDLEGRSVTAYEVNVTTTINGGSAETVYDLQYVDTNVTPNRYYIGGAGDDGTVAQRPTTLDASFYFLRQ